MSRISCSQWPNKGKNKETWSELGVWSVDWMSECHNAQESQCTDDWGESDCGVDGIKKRSRYSTEIPRLGGQSPKGTGRVPK